MSFNTENVQLLDKFRYYLLQILIWHQIMYKWVTDVNSITPSLIST